MINEIKGDLLTAKGVIVHGCNAQGVMGAGVAKQIKRKWPHVFKRYQEWCYRFGDSYYAGGCIIPVQAEPGVIVVNAVTQNDYGNKHRKYTKYDWVDRCLCHVSEQFADQTTISFPLIGCGLGGGHWPVVREIIEHRLPDDKFIKNLYVL